MKCTRTEFKKWPKFSQLKGIVLCVFGQLHVQQLVCVTASHHSVDTCGKLRGTFAVLAVLGPMWPHTIKPFRVIYSVLISLGWDYAQGCPRFFILQVTER